MSGHVSGDVFMGDTHAVPVHRYASVYARCMHREQEGISSSPLPRIV